MIFSSYIFKFLFGGKVFLFYESRRISCPKLILYYLKRHKYMIIGPTRLRKCSLLWRFELPVLRVFDVEFGDNQCVLVIAWLFCLLGVVQYSYILSLSCVCVIMWDHFQIHQNCNIPTIFQIFQSFVRMSRNLVRMFCYRRSLGRRKK